MMTASNRVLLATLTTAIVIVACSDAATVSTQPGPASAALGKMGDSANGRGSGGNGNGNGGAQGDTAGSDTTQSSPPSPGWPRAVLGTIYGVTYTPGGPDTTATERVAGAKVDLYIVPTPVPPAYDTLPPTFHATTTTNAAGEFMFRDLAQAQYQLRVTPPEGSPYQAKTVWFTPQAAMWKMGVSLYR